MTAVREHQKGIGNNWTAHETFSPWTNCGFNSKVNRIEFHKRDDGSMWVSLDIIEFRGKSDRCYEMVGSVSFTPEQTADIIRYLQTGKE